MIVLIGTLACFHSTFGQTILYVDDDAAGSNDGSSWVHAYTDLQSALDEAGARQPLPTEIRVAVGVYRPSKRTDSSDPRTATFQLLNGVALLGGFAGGALGDLRDVARFETVFSGDHNGDDTPGPRTDSNCCAPHEAPGCDDEACQSSVCGPLVECCTDTGWTEPCVVLASQQCRFHCWPFANSQENSYHVLVADEAAGNFLLEGFTVRGGNADGSGKAGSSSFGGGIDIYTGQPTIRDCRFTLNSARFGGGVSIVDAAPSIAQCIFRENIALETGGGVLVWGLREPVIETSLFEKNVARQGGGVFSDSPGGTFNGCIFIRNRGVGGGIYTMYSQSALISNCLFNANATSGVFGAYTRDMFVLNSTFVSNWGDEYGYHAGLGSYSPIDTHVVNCIFWNNHGDPYYQVGANNVTYTLIEEWTGIPPGIGNSGADPMFVDLDGPDDIEGTPDDNLRVLPGSPSIDTGYPVIAVDPGATDLDGHARVLCRRVDIGTYEFGIGDYDCNQAVNLDDFASWRWCTTGPRSDVPAGIGCKAFNFDADSDVDLLDAAGFQRVFGSGP